MYNKLKSIEKELLGNLAQRKTQYSGDIYHYTTPDGLKGIVENSVIWFSDMRFLNDASEMTYIYRIAFEIIVETQLNSKLQEMVRNICNFVARTNGYSIDYEEIIPLDNFYIASFSEDPDNLSLWNYYTKSQNSIGYNINIKTRGSLVIGNNIHFINGEVIYKHDEQKELLKKCLRKYDEFMNEHENNLDKSCGIIQESLVRTLEIYNLFFKPEAYEAEKEYRFVIWNNNENKLKFRINNGILIPYIPVKLKKDAIESICISPSQEQELAKVSLESFISQNEKFITADIKKSDIPKRY